MNLYGKLKLLKKFTTLGESAMNQEKFQALYKLQEKAKRMERFGKDTEALDIYMEIHEKFFPNTSDLYERPAVILEKKQRFEEALALCEKAIERIENNKVSGTVDSFQKRIDHLKERMGSSISYENEKSKVLLFRPSTWKKREWARLIAGMICLVVILHLILPKESPYADLDVNVPTGEGPANGEKLFKEDQKNPYPITEDMVAKACNILEKDVDVKKCNVVINEETIGFAVLIHPGVSKNKAESLAVDFIKALSSAASATYHDLSGPNALSLGALYKHYNLVVSVGTSEKEILAKGEKNRTVSLIQWRD